MVFSSPYVAIIDVGHGNSAVLRDGVSVTIVDCGLGSALLEFLQEQEITSIDGIFLSHADQDHIGGLVGVISSGLFTIRDIFVNPDSSKKTTLWDDLIYALSKSSVAGNITLHTGISYTSAPFECGSIVLKVVSPSPYLATKSPGGSNRLGQKLTTNSVSASFHVIWKRHVVAYLAADIDQLALNDLVDHKISLEAPLLVFPHHGGKTGDSDLVAFANQLCDLVNPKTVIFSIGRNKHDNPRPEVVQTVKLKIKNVRIACTQLSKLCANILPTTLSPHLAPVFSKGKSTYECCSGTFIIKLEENIQYIPDFKSHLLFIAAYAPTSMCTTSLPDKDI